MTSFSANKRSPIIWVMIGIPVIAVLASFTTLALAIRGAEPELPASYHWEGKALDNDLAKLRAGQDLGVHGPLELRADGSVALRPLFADPAYLPPAELTLRLSHATLAREDRVLTLRRDGDVWLARTNALPAGHWLLELTDGHDWLLRREFTAPQATLELGEKTASSSP